VTFCSNYSRALTFENFCQVKSSDSYFQPVGREVGGGGGAGGQKEGGAVGASNRLKVATPNMDSQKLSI
jgi:hypothetical protein